MKWPTPESFKDLTILELPNGGGFEFSAPEGTECANWLNHYNQTEELKKEFCKLIINAILAYIEKDKECGPT